MAIHHEQNHLPPLDALFCEEDHWDYDLEETLESESGLSFNQCSVSTDDLILEDEELISLISKERETHFDFNPNLSIDRKSAVDWMIRVNTHYRFEALTAILAVNYFDRFVSRFDIQSEKPWMVQLVAVTCLSLAAKVEETRVPLLLDFQVRGAKYIFEAKTIQRTELLVLSTLKWKMNTVTPLSFIDRIIPRLGLKSHLNREFLSQCETLLLCVVADLRFVGYLPSMLATATMLHVIEQVEPCNHIYFQNRLLSVLNLTWEKVNACYKLMPEVSKTTHNLHQNKRKYHQISTSLSSLSTDRNSTNDPNNTLSNGPSASSSSSFPETKPHKKMMEPSQIRLQVHLSLGSL